jgi:hypothetical protein
MNISFHVFGNETVKLFSPVATQNVFSDEIFSENFVLDGFFRDGFRDTTQKKK